MVDQSVLSRAALVAAIIAIVAGCSSGTSGSPSTERGGSGCGERSVTIDGSDDIDSIAVTVLDSNGGEGDEIARRIVTTLERARVGGDLSDLATSVGAGELADSGFELTTTSDCRTAVTFDPDVGADSAGLRFVELKVDSPRCDIVRFRAVLWDTSWLLDGVTAAPPAALNEACGDQS